MGKFKKIFLELLIILLVIIIVFCFLAFINWSIHFQEWNGFSRFILGVFGVGVIIKLGDTLNIF